MCKEVEGTVMAIYKVKTAGFLLCLALSACDNTRDTATGALDMAGNETSASYDKVRDLLGLKKKPPQPPTVQARYCYRTQQDIICYGKPIPGFEERLVAYQTTNGGTGYTIEPTPVMNDSGELSPLKSVSVKSPPMVKADTSPLKEVIFDPADLEPKELVPEKQE